MKFNVMSQDSIYTIYTDSIEELRSKHLDENSEISQLMISNDGVTVIKPGDEETRLEIEKHKLLIIHNDIVSNSARFSNLDTVQNIASTVKLPLQELLYFQNNPEINYIESDKDRFFIIEKEPHVSMKDFANKKLLSDKSYSIFPGSIGPKDATYINLSSSQILLIDHAKSAKKIDDILCRDVEKKIVSDIEFISHTGNEEVLGREYLAFSKLASSSNSSFIAALEKNMSKYQKISETIGCNFIFNKEGFSNSKENPEVIFASSKSEISHSLLVQDLLTKFKSSKVVEKNNDYKESAFDAIFVDKETMHLAGCGEDSPGIYLNLISFDNGVEITSPFLLEKNKVYSTESIIAKKPIEIDPFSIKPFLMSDEYENNFPPY